MSDENSLLYAGIILTDIPKYKRFDNKKIYENMKKEYYKHKGSIQTRYMIDLLGFLEKKILKEYHMKAL
jgi:hypothetical protein